MQYNPYAILMRGTSTITNKSAVCSSSSRDADRKRSVRQQHVRTTRTRNYSTRALGTDAERVRG